MPFFDLPPPPPLPNLSLFLLFFLAFSLFFSLSLLFLYKSLTRRRIEEVPRGEQNPTSDTDPSLVSGSLSKLIRETENERTHLTHSLLLEILGSGDSVRVEGDCPASVTVGNLKKKKKRAKKKRTVDGGGDGDCERGEKEGGDSEKAVALGHGGSGPGSGRVKAELVCLYPFTSTSSATQRKIKQHYDQLVKCNETKGLTLAQVGEFANCLIEARNELQHKSEVVKRKFTITKALLFKADRSSIDRLRQQIFKLEMEQKRLEEDAFVYNWLQQQLKLSPAYKKMLEISTCLELKAKSGDLIESNDPEFSDISFEELLAQEKKDSFWQKNAKSRSCSS